MMRLSIVRLILVGILVCASALGSVQAEGDSDSVVKTVLSNGLTILVKPERESRVVAIEVFLKVGATDESEANAGIGQLLAGAVLAGTTMYSPTKLSRLVSEVGGNFKSLWQWNYIEVYALTLPDMSGETIGLLADAIEESRLEPKAIEYVRANILREAIKEKDDAFTSAYTAFRRAAQRGTSYERSYIGNPDRLKLITTDEVKRFYRSTFSPDRIVVSVVGNVDPEFVTDRLAVRFGNMPRLKRKVARDETPAFLGASTQSIQSTGTISYVMVGYPAPGVDSPDYPAMCVANVLLGGNKSSMLFTKLREEMGLGYQVGSLYPGTLGSSLIAGYLGIDSSRATPDTLKTVCTVMTDQFSALRTGSFSDDDLDLAKRYLIGSHALKHERTRDRAFSLGWYEVMGLGYEYDLHYADKIKAVSRDDVKRVCADFQGGAAQVIVRGTASDGH
jgi:predicted Zn-dependent peptidase